MPLAPSFGCPGPIAATAEDLGLAYAVLADQPEALGRMRMRLRGLQVGRVADGYYSGSTPTCAPRWTTWRRSSPLPGHDSLRFRSREWTKRPKCGQTSPGPS